MEDDKRCCGAGNCIIDAWGDCWCGQQWDGEKMCRLNQGDLLISTLHAQHHKKQKINDRDNT